jgi:hypothetical protein
MLLACGRIRHGKADGIARGVGASDGVDANDSRAISNDPHDAAPRKTARRMQRKQVRYDVGSVRD